MSHRITMPWMLLVALTLAALMPTPFWLAALAIAGMAGLGIVTWFSFSRLVEIVAANRFDRPEDRRGQPSHVVIKRCLLTRRFDGATSTIVAEVECQNVARGSASDLHADLVVKVCAKRSEVWITGKLNAMDLAGFQTCTFTLKRGLKDRIDLDATAQWYEIDGTVAYRNANGEWHEEDFTYRSFSPKIDGTIELHASSSPPPPLSRATSGGSRDVRDLGCESA